MSDLLPFLLTLVAAGDERRASVGMPAKIDELVLPGSLLEARPADFTAPVVLRVAAVAPHGTAFRYDLVWYGLEPGAYDLRDWLRRVDGSPTDDLPAIPIDVTSVLPAGQVRPTEPPLREIHGIGGYRVLLVVAGILWLGVLVALLATRHRRKRANAVAGGAVGASTEERLRALVAEALEASERGVSIPASRRAELELLLVEHWRRRLDLGDLPHAAAWRELRTRPESRGCLEQLEAWLHRPAAAGAVFDVRTLLEPYRAGTP